MMVAQKLYEAGFITYMRTDSTRLSDAAKEVLATETAPIVIKAFKEKLEGLADADYVKDNIFPLIKEVQKETGIKGKNLFMPIRIAVSGEMHGPELPDTIYLLGKEKAVNHLAQFIK